MSIHPTAIVAPGARIGPDARIGPYCVIGEHVEIGEGCELVSHVVIDGHTTLGPRCRLHPFVVLGHPPQDLRYAGEPSRLTVGHDCVLREHVTMHTGTPKGGLHTRVGHHGFFMVNAHVAHDCVVGDHVTLVNNVMLAGHAEIGDHVIMGGGAAVHQFLRVGQGAFIGGLAAVEHDVIPYGMALGNRAYLGGLNLVGLKRRGVSRSDLHAIRAAYRGLFEAEGTLADNLDRVAAEFSDQPQVAEIVAFLRAGGRRSVLTPRSGSAGSEA
jgi:UDP-N-acetylglucosamine acyltransferase